MIKHSIEQQSSTRKRSDVGRYFLLRVETPVGVRCASTAEPAPEEEPYQHGRVFNAVAGGLPVIEARELAAEEAWCVQPLAELLAELDAIAASRGAA